MYNLLFEIKEGVMLPRMIGVKFPCQHYPTRFNGYNLSLFLIRHPF